MNRTAFVLARVFIFALLSTGASALAQDRSAPVRLELTPRADLVAGSTTFVAHDVSQWVCLQRMPSSVVVPVNADLSDRAEATREPAAEDVTEWFELGTVEGAAGIDVALERVDQIWDVTPVGAAGAVGVAFRVFCRVVLAMTPSDDVGTSEATERSATAEVTIRNLGGHAFALRYPVRVVSER